MVKFQRSRTSCVEDVIVWGVQAFTSSGAHVSRTSEIEFVWDPNMLNLVQRQFFDVRDFAIINLFPNCAYRTSTHTFRKATDTMKCNVRTYSGRRSESARFHFWGS